MFLRTSRVDCFIVYCVLHIKPVYLISYKVDYAKNYNQQYKLYIISLLSEQLSELKS